FPVSDAAAILHRDSLVCITHDHRPIGSDLPLMLAGGVTSKVYQVTLDVDIGADISKDYVNVSCATHVFPNAKLLNRRAVLLAWLKRLPAGTRIGMEATATYHEL